VDSGRVFYSFYVLQGASFVDLKRVARIYAWSAMDSAPSQEDWRLATAVTTHCQDSVTHSRLIVMVSSRGCLPPCALKSRTGSTAD
jgi:hypothetical protein